MPVTVHAQAQQFQIETNNNTQYQVIAARGAVKMTPAGTLAVLAALNTYYSGLTAAQKAALPDRLCTVNAGAVEAYVVPGTEATLAATLAGVVNTSGNTGRG